MTRFACQMTLSFMGDRRQEKGTAMGKSGKEEEV
jgi:hypothetical protein